MQGLCKGKNSLIWRFACPYRLIIRCKYSRDFRNYTYAKFGKEVIKQPNQMAWQIFDKKVRPMLYSEYDVKSATMVKANTLEELVKKLAGVNSEKAL